MKSFLGESEIEDLRNAIGQFVFYKAILEKTEPERKLFLAIRASVYDSVFSEPIGKLFIETGKVQILVFDDQTETITQWLPPTN